MPAADFQCSGNKCFLLCIFFPLRIVQLVMQKIVYVRMVAVNYFCEAMAVASVSQENKKFSLIKRERTAHHLVICFGFDLLY